MIPLTVTAHLASPPILDRPLLLDGLLLGALGESLGRCHPSGWVAEEEVYAQPLPLARVETEWGWWWAASHALPTGPEAQGHVNRVPLVEEAARWTKARSLCPVSGPDKRLRVPYYTRPLMMAISWSCVGDPDAVGSLLLHAAAVGKVRGHGHGWVLRWDVVRGGPPLEDYGRNLSLRHLPADAPLVSPVPARVTRRHLPLRPPYHARAASVPCWQVQR